MATNFFDNNITTTASEQNLFDITGDAHYATYIFTHNMASGDNITIKVYVKDQNGSAMRLFDTITLQDAQANPAYFISFLPAKQYKVSIQRISGTDRNFTWQRIEVTG